MAEKSPVKKFLIFVSTLLGSIAVVGAVVATSIERRLQGELRSSVFDALEPEWLRTYTFGNPEMLETDLAKVDYEMFYTDLLTGKGFKFSAENNSLTAEDSDLMFNYSKEIGSSFLVIQKRSGMGKSKASLLPMNSCCLLYTSITTVLSIRTSTLRC